MPEDTFWSRVDKSGDCWLWTAGKSDGYGRMSVSGVLVQAHRISYEWAHGTIPDGALIDHTCLVRHCVRPAHLRLATVKQNNENLKSRTNSASGVRGVFRTPQGRWRARVTHNKAIFNVGYYESLEEAEAAVIKKRNELFTHNELDRVKN